MEEPSVFREPQVIRLDWTQEEWGKVRRKDVGKQFS